MFPYYLREGGGFGTSNVACEESRVETGIVYLAVPSINYIGDAKAGVSWEVAGNKHVSALSAVIEIVIVHVNVHIDV